MDDVLWRSNSILRFQIRVLGTPHVHPRDTPCTPLGTPHVHPRDTPCTSWTHLSSRSTRSPCCSIHRSAGRKVVEMGRILKWLVQRMRKGVCTILANDGLVNRYWPSSFDSLDQKQNRTREKRKFILNYSKRLDGKLDFFWRRRLNVCFFSFHGSPGSASYTCVASEMSTGRMDPRVGLGHDFAGNLAGLVGSALRIFQFFTDYLLVPKSIWIFEYYIWIDCMICYDI